MADSWDDAAQVLLRSWPSQVTSWGRDAIVGYCAELQERGVSAAGAVQAFRSHDGAFPPSAGEVAALARQDDLATFDEAWAAFLGALKGSPSDDRLLAKLTGEDPTVAAWVRDFGVHRMRLLPVGDPQYGEMHMRTLRDSWAAFVERHAHDEQQALPAARRGEGLKRLEPSRPALTVVANHAKGEQ